MRIPFTLLARGLAFSFNGSDWLKVSTRTARIITNDGLGRVYYFSASDYVRPY